MSENNIVEIKNEVKSIISNKEVIGSLANYTFKGLPVDNIPKALTEGMLRGYKIEDFLTKKVYAVPFGSNYSLVQSIEDARIKASRSGLSGMSEAVYEYSDDKNTIISCSVTVYKLNGDSRGYTAKVFFKEFNTGKNLWVSKPHAMIAKVAEMHALRKAFPEEINLYVEEEIQRTEVVNELDDEKQIALQEHSENISEIQSVEELQKYYEQNKSNKLGAGFTQLITNRKKELENANT